jgi:hypothetical protein
MQQLHSTVLISTDHLINNIMLIIARFEHIDSQEYEYYIYLANLYGWAAYMYI